MMRSHTHIATPPGETIKEQLEDRGMTQKEFAARMDMSEKHISQLINGEVKLTSEVAHKLELVLGPPASFWNNLEAIYREKLIKVQEENAQSEEADFAKKFPYAKMAKNGWVPPTKNPSEKAAGLKRFFEVVQLKDLFEKNLIPAIVCRRQSVTEKADYALIAWAQKAKIEARAVSTNRINYRRLEEQLLTIRSMTTEDPKLFCPRLLQILADCGIALVFLPHIGGSFLHGATFRDDHKIVVGLTLRGKDADKFWFSLFHEIGHILLGHLERGFEVDTEAENAADRFARDALIPPESFEVFVKRNPKPTGKSIVMFADEIGIDPGIVVGRLQKEGYIDYSWHNDLKTQYGLA